MPGRFTAVTPTTQQTPSASSASRFSAVSGTATPTLGGTSAPASRFTAASQQSLPSLGGGTPAGSSNSPGFGLPDAANLLKIGGQAAKTLAGDPGDLVNWAAPVAAAGQYVANRFGDDRAAGAVGTFAPVAAQAAQIGSQLAATGAASGLGAVTPFLGIHNLLGDLFDSRSPRERQIGAAIGPFADAKDLAFVTFQTMNMLGGLQGGAGSYPELTPAANFWRDKVIKLLAEQGVTLHSNSGGGEGTDTFTPTRPLGAEAESFLDRYLEGAFAQTPTTPVWRQEVLKPSSGEGDFAIHAPQADWYWPSERETRAYTDWQGG